MNFKNIDKELFPKLQNSGLVGEKVGIYGSGGRSMHPNNYDAFKREMPNNNYLMKHINRSKQEKELFGGESV
jgi:hypothetical protein